MDILYLAIGLIILIAVNIVLGSLNAMFCCRFHKKKLMRGVMKAGIVILCFAATYFVGYLNPDIVAVEVNGVKVTVMTSIHLVVLVGYYYYAKQVVEKLGAIVKGEIFVKELELFPPANGDNPNKKSGGGENGSAEIATKSEENTPEKEECIDAADKTDTQCEKSGHSSAENGE